jgi:hypothetical protein
LAVLVYWWNPLLVKETFNSGHLDVIAFPFVLEALLLNLRKKISLVSGSFNIIHWYEIVADRTHTPDPSTLNKET